MTVKEIRTLVEYNCFNKELWDRWSRNRLSKTLIEYMTSKVLEKWFFFALTSCFIMQWTINEVNGKINESSVAQKIVFCICFLISLTCWFTWHWCRLGNDIEKVARALGQNASFVIRTPIKEIEGLVTYRLCVQASLVLSMENSFGRGSHKAQSAVKEFKRLHEIYLRFGLCEEKWDTYFQPVKE
jgi:hypothetical protein